MQIYVFFETKFYLLDFQPFLGKSVAKYQEEFEEWLYEDVTIFDNGEEFILCKPKKMDWGINEFLEWIQETSPFEGAPRILEEHAVGEKFDENIPIISF